MKCTGLALLFLWLSLSTAMAQQVSTAGTDFWMEIARFDGLTEGWDGTFEGKPCPQGSYVYYIYYDPVAGDHNRQAKIGTVTLLW